MPSKSKAQADFMRAAAHNAEFAAKAGISQKVAREFHAADKRKAAGRDKVAHAAIRRGK